MFTKPITAAALAMGLALAAPLAGPVLAQDGGAEAGSFSDDRLSAFIDAAMAVAEVEQQYRGQLAEAETPEAQQEIIDSANADVMRTIDGTDGITVDQYIEIAQAAQGDSELNARLTEMLEARQ